MPKTRTRTTEHIAYAQRERLAFIEVRAYFCGAVTRAQIEERFGVKPAASARDLIAYRELAPGNLRYNAALRCYQPTPEFAPVFSHSPAHVVNWLRSGTGDGLEVAAAQAVPCETAHDLVQPNLDTLATVTRAITSGAVLEVNYLSLSSGSSIKRLAPVALADTGFRWHLRAYDQSKSRFADFVLTRIESARPTQDPIPDAEKLAQDTQWNQILPLEVVPHPGLPYPAAIELDYGMTNGQLSIAIRAPLVAMPSSAGRLTARPATPSAQVHITCGCEMLTSCKG